jgi:polysaccharide lyase-like protein
MAYKGSRRIKQEAKMSKVVQLFLVFTILIWGRGSFAQTPLWSAGMESGNLSEWTANQCGGEYNSGISNSEASTDFAHSGSWAANLTITTPSAPTSGTRLFRWCEPRTYPKLFYSAWFFFPRNYAAPNFWNIVQWKSKTATRNDPFFILNVGNRADGNMHLYLYNWQTRVSYKQEAASLPAGRWIHIEAYHECAADNTGRVTVWQDGTLLYDVPNVRTRYSDGDCQWSVNNYSDGLSPNTATLYIDDAAIGLSRIGLVSAPPTTTTPPPPTNTKPCRGNGKRKCQ